jgi:hypothetical protein
MERLQQEDMQFLQEVLRVTEGDCSIRVTGIEVSPCCKDGENYMAIVSRVTLRGDRDPDRQGTCTRALKYARLSSTMKLLPFLFPDG